MMPLYAGRRHHLTIHYRLRASIESAISENMAKHELGSWRLALFALILRDILAGEVSSGPFEAAAATPGAALACLA